MTLRGLRDALGRTESGEVLASCRIAVGLAVLIDLAQVVPVRAVLLPGSAGGFAAAPVPWALQGIGVTAASVAAVLALGIGAALAVIAGAGGRVAPLVAWLALSTVVALNPHAGGGPDRLLRAELWLLCLHPGTGAWAVDALRRGRRAVPSWARWLFALQIVVVYASTGVQKLSVHWVPGGDGMALYWILQQSAWQRFDHAWAAWALLPLRLGTWGAWCFEVLSPLWLWALWRAERGHPGRLRWLFAAFGFSMHAALQVLMVVGPFAWASLACYPAFVKPEELDRALRRLGAR